MQAKIVATSTGQEIMAEIRPARLEDIALWREWVRQMPATAEDAHWQWDEYILLAKLYPDELACFVLLAEGQAQGFVLLELEHRNELGQKDVHGLRLSVAPWNRGAGKRYKGVGVALFARSVLLSVERGYEGRFWLESLPGAESFYRHLGLIELPGIDQKTGLRRFKLDATGAAAVLEARRRIFDE